MYVIVILWSQVVVPPFSELCPQWMFPAVAVTCGSRTLSCSLSCRFLGPLFKAQSQPTGKEDLSGGGVDAIGISFRDWAQDLWCLEGVVTLCIMWFLALVYTSN